MSVRGPLSGLTPRGSCLLAAGLSLATFAVLLGQRDLLRISVFLLALPVAAVAIVSRTRYRLSCSRTLEPGRVPAGEATTVHLRLDNVSRLSSGVLLLEDSLPYALGGRPRFVLDRVEPRGVRDVTYPVRSDVRGRYTVGPLAVRLTDPFGLCELSRSFASSSELVMTPALTALPAVRLGGDWAGGGEVAARSVAMSGSDDAATREYRHGDDLRKVHWRSTARTGELMVRQEEQPFQSRATLLLDTRTGGHRGSGPGSSFEWSVSALASIAVSLARGGFGLRLLTADGLDLVPGGIAPTESLLLDALATVQTDRGTHLDPAAERLRRGSGDGVLVAVLGLLRAQDAQLLARTRQGAGVSVAVLVDSGSWSRSAGHGPDPAYEASVAALCGAGWRVLRATQGSRLEQLWPQAAGRSAAGAGPPGNPAPFASSRTASSRPAPSPPVSAPPASAPPVSAPPAPLPPAPSPPAPAARRSVPA